MTAGGSEFRSYTGQEFDEGEHVGAAVTGRWCMPTDCSRETGGDVAGERDGRPRARRMTLAIAHRGEPVGHIENTMEAVQAAIDAGAR